MSEEKPPKAKDKKARNDRRLLGVTATAAASVLGTVAYLSSGNREGTPAHPAPASPLEAPPLPAHTPSQTSPPTPLVPPVPVDTGREIPVSGGHRERVIQSRPEVADVRTPDKKNVAKIIDTKLGDEDQWQLSLEKTSDGNTQVKATVLVPSHTPFITVNYRSDFSRMPDSGSSEEAIRESVQEERKRLRDSYKQGRFTGNSMWGKIDVPSPPVPAGESVGLFKLASDEMLVRRINLGPKESDPVKWLETFKQLPVGLIEDFSTLFDQSDAMTRFIKDVVVNGQTGKVDYDALEMMKRIFALDDAARDSFKNALLYKDYARAAMIVKTMSDAADDAMLREVFDGIKAYAQEAKKSGLTAQEAWDELENRFFYSVQYADIPERYNQPTDTTDQSLQALHRALTPELYAKLQEMDYKMLLELGAYAMPDEGEPRSYEAVKLRVSASLTQEEKKLFQKIERKIPELFGNGEKAGWLDKATSRDKNFPHVLSLFEQLDKLEQFVDHKDGKNVPSVSPMISEGNDGNVYLLLYLPNYDIDMANSYLQRQDRILRAMREGHVVLGSERANGAFVLPPDKRAALFFAMEDYRSARALPSFDGFNSLLQVSDRKISPRVVHAAATGNNLPQGFMTEEISMPAGFEGISVKGISEQAIAPPSPQVRGR